MLCALAYLGFRSLTRQSPFRLESGFSHLAEHCASVLPISEAEILQRQQKLAETLYAQNASAFVAEPGANTLYYANISGGSWHLSERPLLLIISPKVEENGEISASVSVLTPAFEATRARLLPVVANSVVYPQWPEDVSPYEVMIASLAPEGTIYVDGYMRHFIVDGLQKAAPGVAVSYAPVEIRQLRERKSPAELEIMKCAHEVCSSHDDGAISSLIPRTGYSHGGSGNTEEALFGDPRVGSNVGHQQCPLRSGSQ